MQALSILLKYASLASLPLFAIISLFLIRKLPNFSFFQHTFSNTILFLNHPIERLIFKFNFICKALFDLGFVFYVLQHYSVSVVSPAGIVLILAASLFGLLAYFTDDIHLIMHKIIIYSIGIFWTIGEICLASLTKSDSFIRATNVLVTVPLILAFGFFAFRKTNALVQVTCILFMYVWHVIFVFNYL